MPLSRFRGVSALAVLVLAAPAPAPGPFPQRSESPEAVERIATLRSARSVHSATTLPSGHVLIVGGMVSGGGSLATAELLDPTDRRIRTIGSMADARAGHTATLLRDGRVLIAGGYDGSYLSSVETFDPATRRFARAGRLLEARSGHTATLLADGRVLLVGGVGRGWTFLASAELFDPATGRSESVGAMAEARESHTATHLADGRVLIIGGHCGRRAAMVVHASAEAYDPRTRRFEGAGTLGTARHKHDAVRLADGRVLVIGGADRTDRVHFATTEVYDPSTGAFAPGPTMAHARYKLAGTSVLLPGGDVLVASGARAAEVLGAATFTFREVPGRFPEPYHFSATAALPSGDVVVTGGYGEGIVPTDGVWVFRRR